MIFALTSTPVKNIVLQNDDEETPMKMIGKKQVPILEKLDGSFLSESLDIVKFIDKETKILSDIRNKNIETWVSDSRNYLLLLTFPRVIKADLEEFKTQSAVDFFTRKKENSIGMTFEEAMGKTPELKLEAEYHIKLLSPLITKLPSVKNKDFSEDDIILFPILRLLSVVYGLKWEKNVSEYMKHISTITQIPLFKPV